MAQFNHLACANKCVLTLKLRFILEIEGRLGGAHNFYQNLEKGKKPFNFKKRLMLKLHIGLTESLRLVVQFLYLLTSSPGNFYMAGPTSCTAEITMFSKLYVLSEQKHTP